MDIVTYRSSRSDATDLLAEMLELRARTNQVIDELRRVPQGDGSDQIEVELSGSTVSALLEQAAGARFLTDLAEEI